MSHHHKIAVKLPHDTYARVQERANKEGTSFSVMAARMIECGLMDYEDSERHEPIKINVFVYGTLKRGYSNNMRLSTSKFLGEAVSIDATYSMTSSGVPFLEEGGEKKVKGELWEVDEQTLASLDSLEGHPNMYCRKERWFVSEQGKRVQAWVYLSEHRAYRGVTEHGGELLSWP